MLLLSAAPLTAPAPSARAAEPPRFEPGDTIEGEMLAHDGDTLERLVGGEIVGPRIRLHGITAPEMDTIEGWYARAMLDVLIRDSHVRCEVVSRDRHKRPVAVCGAKAPDGQGPDDLAATLLVFGYAATWRRYLQEAPRRRRDLYLDLEARAIAAGNGLWGLAPQDLPTLLAPE